MGKSDYLKERNLMINELRRFIKENSNEEICCDICGSNEKEIISTKARINTKVTTVICKTCGLIYISPRLSDEKYKEFYEKYNRDSKGVEYHIDPDKLKNRIKSEIKSQIGLGNRIIKCLEENNIDMKNKKILDIGCAEGFALLPFKEKLNCEVVGFDYDEKMIEVGEKRNLNIYVGGTESIKGKFDLIILSNIIEHLLFPKQELKKILMHLNDGGYLYATQTGVYATKYHYGYDIDYFFRVEHPYAYSLRTFTNLINLVGLRPIMANEGIHVLAKKTKENKNIVSDYDNLISFVKECHKKKFKNIRKYLFNLAYPVYKKIGSGKIGWKNKVVQKR